MVTGVEIEPSGFAAPAPLMHYTRRMGDDRVRWERIGDYAIWTGSRAVEESPHILMEKREAGVLTLPVDAAGPVLHRIPAGIPYRASGLFGFWHSSDADTVWVQTAYESRRFYSMMLGGARGRPSIDLCEWYCPRCAHPLQQRSFHTASASFSAFLGAALEWVREFNSEPATRECAECCFQHPPGYGFYPQDDTPDEAAARASW
jgi:hypothetical protein